MTLSPINYLSGITDVLPVLRELRKKDGRLVTRLNCDAIKTPTLESDVQLVTKSTDLDIQSALEVAVESFATNLDKLIQQDGKSLSGKELLTMIDQVGIQDADSEKSRNTLRTYFASIYRTHQIIQGKENVELTNITTASGNRFQLRSHTGMGKERLFSNNSDTYALFEDSSIIAMVNDGVSGNYYENKLCTGRFAANQLINFFGVNANRVEDPLEFAFINSPKEIVDQINESTRLEDLFKLLLPEGEKDNDQLHKISNSYLSQGDNHPKNCLMNSSKFDYLDSDPSNFIQGMRDYISSFDSAEALLNDFGINRFDDKVVNALALYEDFHNYLECAMKADPQIKQQLNIYATSTSTLLLDLGDKLAVISVGDIVPIGYNDAGITLLKKLVPKEAGKEEHTDAVGVHKTTNEVQTRYTKHPSNFIVRIFDKDEFNGIVLMSDGVISDDKVEMGLRDKLHIMLEDYPNELFRMLLEQAIESKGLKDDMTIVSVVAKS